MIRHIFAGGNTPDGFYSYFDNILPFGESRKTIYMKGGSGTGKSTFMKKVGSVFEDKKYDLEYFHCSNDPDSLDGICIPKLKIAIVDATAPHTQDPVLPVAMDEILNVAVCLDSKGLRPYAEELKSILAEKKELIRMAYGYLHAGYSLYKNNTGLYEKSLNKGALNIILQEILDGLFKEKTCTEKLGGHRKLFASAITPSGFVDYSKYLFTSKEVILLKGTEGCGADMILAKIQEAANRRGYRTEGYYSPLSPNQLEHLIIPELDCCFATSNPYHKLNPSTAKKIDLYELCDQDLLSKHRERMDYNIELFDELARKAMNLLDESRTIHNRVEEIYISNMDFKQLNIMYDNTIKQLLELES